MRHGDLILAEPVVDETRQKFFIAERHPVVRLDGNILSNVLHSGRIVTTVVTENATSGVGGSDIS